MEPSTITYTNPNTGFTISAVIPVEIVAVLQWMRDNVKLPQYAAPAPAGASETGKPPVPKYEHEAHVIYRDVLEVLVPLWASQYQDGQVAQLQVQVDATKKQIQDAMRASMDKLVVVESPRK